MTTMHETTAGVLQLAPPVRYLPCAEFHSEPDDVELCAGCGWSTDDHDAAVEHELAA